MNIRLIALDLDGTTLNSRSELTPKTKAVLEKAIEKGVHVVVATGRTFSAVPEEVKEIKGMEYICTSNGAEIRNLRENTLVYSNYLRPETIEEVVSILSKEDFMLEVFVDGIAYTDAVNYRRAVEGTLSYRNQRYIVDTRNPVDDIYTFMLEHKDRIENVNVNFSNMDDKWRMQPVLEAIENATVTSSFDHNWEIGGATTSKAEALRNLCIMLDLSADEIMAAGDSPNDGAMLALAGLPVAVGNAKQVIKDQAEYITGTNDEDGVACAIEKFVL